MYDCGSVSSKVSEKLQSLKEHSKISCFFKTAVFKNQILDDLKIPFQDQERSDQNNSLFQAMQMQEEDSEMLDLEQFQEENSEMIDVNIQNTTLFSMSNPISIPFVKTEENVRDAIEYHKLKYLFIILSHPDTDHIRFITEDTIPKKPACNCYLRRRLVGRWRS